MSAKWLEPASIGSLQHLNVHFRTILPSIVFKRSNLEKQDNQFDVSSIKKEELGKRNEKKGERREEGKKRGWAAATNFPMNCGRSRGEQGSDWRTNGQVFLPLLGIFWWNSVVSRATRPGFRVRLGSGCNEFSDELRPVKGRKRVVRFGQMRMQMQMYSYYNSFWTRNEVKMVIVLIELSSWWIRRKIFLPRLLCDSHVHALEQFWFSVIN